MKTVPELTPAVTADQIMIRKRYALPQTTAISRLLADTARSAVILQIIRLAVMPAEFTTVITAGVTVTASTNARSLQTAASATVARTRSTHVFPTVPRPDVQQEIVTKQIKSAFNFGG